MLTLLCYCADPGLDVTKPDRCQLAEPDCHVYACVPMQWQLWASMLVLATRSTAARHLTASSTHVETSNVHRQAAGQSSQAAPLQPVHTGCTQCALSQQWRPSPSRHTRRTPCSTVQGQAAEPRQPARSRSQRPRIRAAKILKILLSDKERTGAAQDDRAGLAQRHAGEVYQAVLTHHDLLNDAGPPQAHRFQALERGGYLPACRPEPPQLACSSRSSHHCSMW